MAGERIEAPTPSRRAEVRKRGQTARSRRLTSATVLPAGLYTIKLLAAGVQGKLSALPAGNIPAVGDLDQAAAPSAGPNVLGVGILPPLLGTLALAAVAASVLQGGFMFAPGLLTPKWERVNPITRTRRIWSTPGLLRPARTPAKLGPAWRVAVSVMRGHLGRLAGRGGIELMPKVGRLVRPT